VSDKIKLEALIKETHVMPFIRSNGKIMFAGRGLVERKELQKEIDQLTAKVGKLKELLLLTDPVVSNDEEGDTQLRQWTDFIKCYPSEGDLNDSRN